MSGWVSDRLYEAGAEDTISGIGDASMTVADTGKWTALAVLLGVRIGFAAKDFLSPPRIQVQEARGSTAAQDIPTREKRKADIQSQIAKMSKVKLHSICANVYCDLQACQSARCV